jgi:hypothetical protein
LIFRDEFADDDQLFVPGGGGSIGVQFPQIGRTNRADVYTREANKDYRPVYQKGRVRPGMTTLPFGYKDLPHHQQ